MKQPTYKPNPSKGKVKSQQADLIYGALNNGNGNGNDNNGNGGNNGNGNGNDKDKNNNGNGNDKDKNGNGNDKDKNNNGNGNDNGKQNKDLTKEERNKKKEEAKKGQGYKQKGKYTNRGKHLGWYKNRLASGEQIEVTNYLNDVSDDLSQVLMTYNDDGVYDTAYTYGNERIGIDILDGTRPDAQNPLYYLYDGEGSVSYITKPDGEIRDTYKYDEFGKPKTGKLSPDGDKILHTSFGYTGEQWDEESQLQYLRARYYDPEIGRFINRDTYEGEVENPLSKNLYAYVQNNPVNFTDPTGHKMEPGSTEWFKHVKKDWTKEQKRNLQLFLNNNGYRDNQGKKLVVNGIYGDRTYQAHLNYFKGKKYKYPKVVLSKTGHTRKDTGFEDLPDKEIHDRARDKSLSGEERRKYQKEEKLRKMRNKQKRNSHYIERQVPRLGTVEKIGLVAGGVGVIVGTLVEDVISGGGGVIDDPVTLSAGSSMILKAVY